jgi:hypothetical protein
MTRLLISNVDISGRQAEPADPLYGLVIFILTSPRNKINSLNREDFKVFKKIKTFELEDLKGRNLDVKSFTSENVELIIAADTASGEIFILKQIIHPTCESVK